MGKSILFFLSSFNRGGAEWVICNLANNFSNRGIKILIVSVKNGNMFAELNQNIKIKHFNGSYSKTFIYVFFVLLTNKYQVMLTTQRNVSVFAYFIRVFSFSKTKHIVRESASNFSFIFKKMTKIEKKIWQLFFSVCYKNSFKIIVNSFGTLMGLHKANIINANNKNTYVISNPIDIKKIISKSKDDDTLYVKNGDKIIVSVGRLVKHKNMDLLINSMLRIIEMQSNTKLIIIGDGPEMNNLKDLTAKLNLIDKIIFTGQIDNPYTILKRASLFVLISQWEGFGQVVVESLALGVPVVVTNNEGGPKEIINNGEFGTMVNIDTPESVAQGIIWALKNVKDKNILIKRAHDFDIESIASKYECVVFGNKCMNENDNYTEINLKTPKK